MGGCDGGIGASDRLWNVVGPECGSEGNFPKAKDHSIYGPTIPQLRPIHTDSITPFPAHILSQGDAYESLELLIFNFFY